MTTPSRARAPRLARAALLGLAPLTVFLFTLAWVHESGPLLTAAAAASALLVTTLLAAAHAATRAADAEARAAVADKDAALTRLQAIVDSMVDGVIFVDEGGRIALVNEAGRALKNLRQGAGGAVEDCHPKATHEMLGRVMSWLRDGGPGGPGHSIIKEKEQRWETTYAGVRGKDGRHLGVVMVIRDIADRRNLERRLLDAERLAAVGQMSAQVAHELRNPLNAIAGAAQYLERAVPDNGDVKEYAELIAEQVARVNRFVGELLRIARPANPALAPSSIGRALAEAARTVTLARGLPPDAVRVDAGRGLPVLDLDASMIQEALVNLVDNALDAGGEPERGRAPVELTARFESRGGEGHVVVEVLDRGCGIPADQLDEVTRPFVTTKASGTGLGLVLVARAAEQHRATFELVPREGGGTVARLRLAVRTRRRAEREAPEPAAAGTAR